MSHLYRALSLGLLLSVCCAFSSSAHENSAAVDPSANAVRQPSGIVSFPLGINSTSRAYAMDVRNQREVRMSLTNAAVTQFGVATAGRPLYAGDFDGAGIWYCISTPDSLYSVDTTSGAFTFLGLISGIPAGSNTSGITWDYSSNTMYLCNLLGGVATLYTLDLGTRAVTPIGAILTGTLIDIAASNSGQLYGIKFATAAGVSDTLVSINKTTGAGTSVGPLGVDVNFAHGLDFDPVTDTLFYPGYIGSGVNNLYWINLTTGQATVVGAPASGEYDCFAVVGRPPTGPDTLLVIFNDSTTGTATNIGYKKADRDTTNRYLDMYAPGPRRYVYNDTAGTQMPNLANYKRILYVESSFDNILSRYMGANTRAALKNWLNAGTPSDRRRLVMVGGDLGYNYSRTQTGGAYDTVLAHQMMKYVYGVDNGNTAGSVTGIAVNPGMTFAYSTTVGGFWPDGNTYRPGGTVLYKYTNRATADSGAAIGYVATGYTSVCVFQDPRYYTGTFGPILQSALQYAGAITDVPTYSSELPNDFTLMQNYPNPFNPSTTIEYGLVNAANISLKIYDVLGREVTTLASGPQTAGTYRVVWDGRNAAGHQVSTGVYFYRLEVRSGAEGKSFASMKKMLFMK